MCCPKAAAANEIKLNFELICLSSLQKANVTPLHSSPAPLTLHAKVKQLIWLSIDINLARGASSTMGNQGLKQRCLYNALLCCCAALLLLDAKISCTKLISDVCQTGEGDGQRRRRRWAGAGGHSCRYIQKCETAVAPRETERGRSAKHVAFHIYNFFFFLYFFTTRWIYLCACVCVYVCMYVRVFILEIFIGYGKYKLINLPHNYGHTTNNNNNNPCLLSGELYFSIYFVAARAPKMRRYIFRIGRAHVFEISKLFYVFKCGKKWNEKKTRRAEEDQASNGDHWYKQNVIPKKRNEKVSRGCLTVPDKSIWTSIAI